MKKIITFTFIALVGGFIFFMSSCKKNHDSTINIEFENIEITKTEGDPTFTIRIEASGNVRKNELVAIQINYPNEVTIGNNKDLVINSFVENDIIIVGIAKGESFAEIQIEVLADFIEENMESIEFNIIDVTNDLEIGTFSSCTLSILDQAFENKVRFTKSSITQFEGGNNDTIWITTEYPVTFQKEVVVSVTPGTDFILGDNDDAIITKDIENNQIELIISANQTSAYFVIISNIDLLEDEIDESITFEITDADDGLTISDNNTLTYTLSNVGSLVASYPFNGNANDIICSNNGTIFGATPIENRHGEANTALYFDGINDYVNIPFSERVNFDYNEDFTISIWVDPDHDQNNLNGQTNTILLAWNDHGTTPYPYCIRYINQNAVAPNHTEYTFEALRNDGFPSHIDPEVRSNINCRDNGWNHIVFIKSGTMLYLYINNILVDSTTDNTVASKNNLDLRVGCRVPTHPTSDRFFSGKIDDIKFYNKALTTSEINDLDNE